MRTTLAVILLTVSLVSCGNMNQDNLPPVFKNTSATDVIVVEIDGCEYLQYHVYGYEAITHKGNCKYCEQRRREVVK